MSGFPDRFPDRLARARAADRAALGELLDAYRPVLTRRADRLLGGRIPARADAVDVVQQTFLDAHATFPRFTGTTEPELVAWLVTILDYNVVRFLRDHTRTGKRAVGRERPLDPDPATGTPPGNSVPARLTTPSARAMRAEDAARLMRALDALPPDQREAVRLRHIEGWPLDAIAGQTGRSLSAAAGLIKRGMQALREALRKDAEAG